jgi:hypothetical protein
MVSFAKLLDAKNTKPTAIKQINNNLSDFISPPPFKGCRKKSPANMKEIHPFQDKGTPKFHRIVPRNG